MTPLLASTTFWVMLVALLESIKYIGHLLPIAILRIYIGYFFLNKALVQYYGDFLTQPRLAEMISQNLNLSSAPDWFVASLENYAIPYWQFFALLICCFEFLLGISFIFGYLVRPFAFLAALLSISYMWMMGPQLENYYFLLFAVNLCLSFLGAGRCFGLDYYFYKRHRGIWW